MGKKGCLNICTKDNANGIIIIRLSRMLMEISAQLRIIYKNILQHSKETGNPEALNFVIEDMELILRSIEHNLSGSKYPVAYDYNNRRFIPGVFVDNNNDLLITDQALSNNAYFIRQCEKFKISGKEQDTVKLLIKGHIYKEIAALLNIKFNTVKERVKNIYKKCNVQNKMELANLFTQKLN